MRLIKLLSIFLFLVTFTNSNAQEDNELILEGTIGKAHIVMKINLDSKDINASYYYKKYKHSIPLNGKYIDGQTIELESQGWNYAKETFRIKDIGKGAELIYSGTWRSESNNASLPVILRLADISKITVKNSYVKKAGLTDYDYIRIAGIQIKIDSSQILSEDISITWHRDTISGFSGFRIKPNNNLQGIDSINNFLEDLQYNEILSTLDCNGSEYDSGFNSIYVRGHVISFALSTSYECGGAHPDFGTRGYTFNLETGKPMLISDFLFFGKTKADYPKEDYKYGSEVLGPNLVKILTKLYPHEMRKPTEKEEEEGECYYNTEDVWQYASWYLTKNGLYLYPYFYRAARACDGADFSVIPYSELIKYKNPKVDIPMKY